MPEGTRVQHFLPCRLLAARWLHGGEVRREPGRRDLLCLPGPVGSTEADGPTGRRYQACRPALVSAVISQDRVLDGFFVAGWMTHTSPLLIYSAPGGLRQDPGRAA